MTDNEAIRKAKALYAKEWRKKNPDKQKAIAERYWLKKANNLKRCPFCGVVVSEHQKFCSECGDKLI